MTRTSSGVPRIEVSDVAVVREASAGHTPEHAPEHTMVPAPRRGSSTALALRRHSTALDQGFAVGQDGTPIYYRLGRPRGRVAGPAVVFSDGIGCDGYAWKYLEPDLRRDRAIVHWHYRGHGKTPLPRDPARVTIADCADDLAAVLDAAGRNLGGERPLDRVFLAGHSMGVQVCLETYRRYRHRVAGLILMCGSYGTPLRTFRGSRRLEDMLPIIRLGIHAMPRAVSRFWKATLPTQFAFEMATLLEIDGSLVRREDFFPYLEHMANLDVRLFVDMLAAAGRHTAREMLPEIAAPTLIIAGDRDGFTPLSLSEDMHRLIPGSELHVVRGGSHTAPIEKPDEVTRASADFVRRHG
jgi:pimeloyl-ACP methyl ester carboxylesterase